MSYIIFDGTKIGNLASGESGFDVDIFPVEMDSSPARQFTRYDPIGRNGSILIDDQKYPNVQTSYRVLIRENSGTLFRDLCGFLQSRTGYCRLSDSWHPDEYYQAYVSEPITPIFDDNRGALKFYLTFTRKPQRFLVSGETPIHLEISAGNWDYAFVNPSPFPARPLFAFKLKSTWHDSYTYKQMYCVMRFATIPAYQTSAVHDDYWYYINLNTNDLNVDLDTKVLTSWIVVVDFERRSVYLAEPEITPQNATLEKLLTIGTNLMNDWVYVTKYPNHGLDIPVPPNTETFDFPEIAGHGKTKTVMKIGWDEGNKADWSVVYPRWWTV